MINLKLFRKDPEFCREALLRKGVDEQVLNQLQELDLLCRNDTSDLNLLQQMLNE